MKKALVRLSLVSLIILSIFGACSTKPNPPAPDPKLAAAAATNYLDTVIGRGIRHNGTPVTQRSALNFGSGITATDDPANNQTTITATGGGSTTVANLAALRALH